MVHQNNRLSEVIVTDVLDSDHRRKALEPVKKLTDRDLSQILASELISSNNQIHSSDGADKAVRDFIASIASTYTISTRNAAIVDRKYLAQIFH
jgi:secreted Zn-dependent insulinase-like peptidase